ncbi:MAG: hypothetical protein KIT33_00290 [Candidatus Kapabacteria bacterium]|nr:hypothetical protein [Ignavibacteriota bacterium]MCW5883386.1 hypothetical protein [Candidatus Kapabacteria bacterium]
MKLSRILMLLAFTLVVSFISCSEDSKNTTGPDNKAPENLGGNIEGVLKEGTYIVTDNLIVPIGKTLTIEPGVKLIFDGDGIQGSSPEIAVFGQLIAEGTPQKRIIMTVDDAKKGIDNFARGYWGGIQCYQTCNRLVLRYCDIEYTGGPAGELINPDYVLRNPGSTRYTLMNDNQDGDYIVEHCHFFGIADDLWRPLGGRISFCYNLVEFQGETGGDCINAKGGTVGILAYNLVIGSATNGLKTGNGGDKTIQTNIDIYNNTVVTSGYRRAQAGRGGSINVEEGARGQIYNNLMVNCRFGPRMVDGFDAVNTVYGYNYNFASFQSLIDEIYPTAGVTVPQSTDINSATPGDKDPMFVNYTVDYTEAQLREGILAKLNVLGNQNFRLKAGSPALGKGFTGFTPVRAPNGTTAPAPSSDIGCYPASGNGNKF